MRAVLQRVSEASVRIDGALHSAIGPGLLILLGVRQGDSVDHALELARRCAHLRIFEDDQGRMNRSLSETGGMGLVVSQFTLAADTRKGNRPGFGDAAPPEKAEALYLEFVGALRSHIGSEKVKTGLFRAMMDVSLVNNGPVTIVIEDRLRLSQKERGIE